MAVLGRSSFDAAVEDEVPEPVAVLLAVSRRVVLDEDEPEPTAVRGRTVRPDAVLPAVAWPDPVADRGRTSLLSAEEVPVPDPVAVRFATNNLEAV